MACQYCSSREQDGLHVWNLPKPAAIALLPQERQLARTVHAFYQALHVYYPQVASVEDAIRVIEAGIAFFEAAKVWRAEQSEERSRTGFASSPTHS